jgi:hypothetical protein
MITPHDHCIQNCVGIPFLHLIVQMSFLAQVANTQVTTVLPFHGEHQLRIQFSFKDGLTD